MLNFFPMRFFCLSVAVALLIILAGCASLTSGNRVSGVEDETASGLKKTVNPYAVNYNDEYTDPGYDVIEATASATPAIEGYLSAFSVRQGDTILLYVNTSLPEYNFRVYETRPVGAKVRANYTNIPGVQQVVPPDAWVDCCDWTDPVEITIPANWDSGLYRIQLSPDQTYKFNKPMLLSFIVTEDVPGSRSQILVLDNAATQIAYNEWGGASSYWHQTPGAGRAYELSVLRPGNNTFQWAEENFIQWTRYMGITTEYASMMDLETNPSLLFAYQTVVLAAHSEYWSRNQRNALDAFIAGGGNVVVLGGNNMWWQVRFEGDRMPIYKDPYLDPMLGVNDELVTYYWHDWPVNDPENRTIALSFRNGGLVNNAGIHNGAYYQAIDGYGGYTVANAAHRYLAGTGLADGSQFGRLEEIVGNEVDGAEFDWVNGYAVVTGADGAPTNYEIIATSPADGGSWQGFGTPGVFDTGYGDGRLFNAATIRWSFGLWDPKGKQVANPFVSKIMLNVLAEMQPDSAASCAYSIGASDYDADGIDDSCDNCVAVANPAQTDVDANGTGDVCEAIEPVNLAVDIKPFDMTNTIDLNTETNLAITLSTHTRGSEGPLEFDATQIDPASISVGPGAAGILGTPVYGNWLGDSRPDMIFSIATQDAAFACESDQLIMVRGQSFSGQQFEAMQKITTGPCKTASCH